MPSPKVLVHSEAQTASSRNWTRATESISFYDNRYAKRALAITNWFI